MLTGFISWSAPAGREVAEALKEYLGVVLPTMPFFVSSKDIKSGAVWIKEIGDQLNTVVSGIAVVTPDSLKSPWLFFEAGALAKEGLSRGQPDTTLYPYLFGVEKSTLAGTPLSGFFAETASRSGTLRLVKSIYERTRAAGLPQHERLEAAADALWPQLEEKLERIKNYYDIRFKLSEDIGQLDDAILTSLSHSSGEVGTALQRNPYLQTVVRRSLAGEIYRMRELFNRERSSFSIPHNLYPAYLTHLLGEHEGVPLKALAILDRDETYWLRLPAEKILEATNEDCIRVFAFHDVDHLWQYLPMVRSHSRKYEVRVISVERLHDVFLGKPYDFSICAGLASTSAIVARYSHDPEVSRRELSRLSKNISFHFDGRSISEHTKLFTGLVAVSTQVEKGMSDDVLIDLVFRDDDSVRRKTAIAPVEMSAYINIIKYKQHEWRHAYYLEMHDVMMRYLEDHRSKLQGGRLTVLEVGSGTGLFTVKAAKAGNLDITTIDMDWACYTVLTETLEELEGVQEQNDSGPLVRKQRHTKDFETGSRKFVIPDLDVNIYCHCEDARDFDPGGPDGRYHCIVSSFADHHIARADKEDYFSNIKDNLEIGGVFIVGDEFLPPHESNSPKARKEALRRYHQHIIDRTREVHGDAAEGLVALERAALHSGEKEVGDFKVSCEDYESQLRDFGFSYSKIRVGPDDTSLAQEVGGVYVYVISSG